MKPQPFEQEKYEGCH